MTDKVLDKKDIEKFFFHMNIFDEDVEEEIEEELPPPPPTFSEEELAGARKSGYEKGKLDGAAEATKAEKESRAQMVAEILQRIGKETTSLFAKEQERATLYEQEVTALCLSVFEKLFPVYNEQHGFEELKASIAEILEKQQNQVEIQIYVQPDIQGAIEEVIGKLEDKGFQAKISVHGDEKLSDGACRMSWNDGGAARDPQALAEQIKALMQQTLAGGATNRHDREEGSESQPEKMQAALPDTGTEPAEEIQTPDTADNAGTSGET